MIQWQSLTPAARNALVAEKVMGLSETTSCMGTLVYESTDIRAQHAFYRCLLCGTRYTVTEYFLRACGVPKEHTTTLPCYSESIDAAWEIVEKLSAGCTLERVVTPPYALHAQKPLFYEVTLYLGNPPLKMQMAKADTPAHAICIAALRACGQEID